MQKDGYERRFDVLNSENGVANVETTVRSDVDGGKAE